MPTKRVLSKKHSIINNGFGTHLTAVLKEMCRRVKTKYEGIDFKAQDWYCQHVWSLDDEHGFEEWMAEYLRTTLGARHELLETFLHVNKGRCLQAAQEFTFNYGWKLSG